MENEQDCFSPRCSAMDSAAGTAGRRRRAQARCSGDGSSGACKAAGSGRVDTRRGFSARRGGRRQCADRPVRPAHRCRCPAARGPDRPRFCPYPIARGAAGSPGRQGFRHPGAVHHCGYGCRAYHRHPGAQGRLRLFHLPDRQPPDGQFPPPGRDQQQGGCGPTCLQGKSSR